MRLENADVRQIAVLFRVIQTVADDEGVRHGEADVLRLHIGAAARGLIEQRCDADGARLAVLEIFREIAERDAGVENVFDDDDITVFNVLAEILVDLHRARGGGAVAVGRNGHKVHAAVDRHFAEQVRHENEAALQNADEQRLFPGVIAGDLRAQLADARMDLLLTEQYGRNIFSHSLSSSEIGEMVIL